MHPSLVPQDPSSQLRIQFGPSDMDPPEEELIWNNSAPAQPSTAHKNKKKLSSFRITATNITGKLFKSTTKDRGGQHDVVGAQNTTPEEKANTKPGLLKKLPYLAPEIQMRILEFTDWIEHPRLAKVCKFWRNFLQTSPIAREKRYFIVLNQHKDEAAARYLYFLQTQKATVGYQIPRFHRALRELQYFVRIGGKDSSRDIPWPYQPRPIRLEHHSHGWPQQDKLDFKAQLLEPYDYQFFKHDPLMIYEGDSSDQKMEIGQTTSQFLSILGDHNFLETTRFDSSMTFGDYIAEATRVANLDVKTVPRRAEWWNNEGAGDGGASGLRIPIDDKDWQWSHRCNAIWLSVRVVIRFDRPVDVVVNFPYAASQFVFVKEVESKDTDGVDEYGVD